MKLLSPTSFHTRFPLRLLAFASIALLLHYLAWDTLSDIAAPTIEKTQTEKLVAVQLTLAAEAAADAAKDATTVTTKVTTTAETKSEPHATQNATAQLPDKLGTNNVIAPPSDLEPDTPPNLPAPLEISTTHATTGNAGEKDIDSTMSGAENNQTDADKKSSDDDVVDVSRLRVLPPPSGKMHMKVMYVAKNMNPVYGIGDIQWMTRDNTYQMQIEASLDLLLTTLRLYKLQSEGTIGQYGIAPQQMTESRRGRAETATHFHYDTKIISFSATTAVTPLSAGAQDKATIMMQLSGLGIAAPEQFVTGRRIAIQVAENREAEKFIFVISGQEEIQTSIGNIQTWHIIRPPRTGLYNSTLELWFAPAYHWFPLQLRNTEPNGAVTTQTVDKIQFNASPEN